MICQNLAEKLYRIGDGILNSGSSYTFNTLELWAVTERISLEKPSSGEYSTRRTLLSNSIVNDLFLSTDIENASYDFGHLLDFVYNLKYLHVGDIEFDNFALIKVTTMMKYIIRSFLCFLKRIKYCYVRSDCILVRSTLCGQPEVCFV